MARANTPYTLRGRLVDGGGTPLGDLRVSALDHDPGRPPDPLGDAETGDDGRFEITFPPSKAGGRGEGAPEPFLRVFAADADDEAPPLTQTEPVRMQGQDHDFGDVTVEPDAGGEPLPDDSGMGGAGPLHDVQHAHTPSVHGRTPRGLHAVPRSPFYEGRFGRLFRRLPPLNEPPNEAFEDLADTMFGGATGDNEAIPSGYTYFGQFVDHDITFDPTSKLQSENDPNALENFRTPRFDLDSLYGRGPLDAPFMYRDELRFLLGKTEDDEDDCPRVGPPLPSGTDPVSVRRSRRAILGDPRNDENIIVNQLHLALLKYHNRVVDDLDGTVPDERLFDEACRTVRWHYQWAVVHDFLRRLVGDDIVESLFSEREAYPVYKKQDGRKKLPQARLRETHLEFYGWQNQPWMPVEFAVAAYRFGHSQVRPDYRLNDTTPPIPIFSRGGDANEFGDLRGFRERPRFWEIAWERFFEFPEGDASKRQPSRRIDTTLAPGLSELPFARVVRSLATRNLLRGKALGLPAGQAVATAMGIPPDLILGRDDMGLAGDLADRFGDRTPLWYYVLKEAEVVAGGEKLGPVGGRIVAEVLVGLLLGDPNSYLASPDMWKPKKDEFGASDDGTFTVPDLLRHAGMKITG
jgi:hypothetical protein